MTLLTRLPSLQAGIVFALAGAGTAVLLVFWLRPNMGISVDIIPFSAVAGVASGIAATLVWRTVIVPRMRFGFLPGALAGVLVVGLAGGGLVLLTFADPLAREPMESWLPSVSQTVLHVYAYVSPVLALVGSAVGGVLAKLQGKARASISTGGTPTAPA